MNLNRTAGGVGLNSRVLAYPNFPAKVSAHLLRCPTTPTVEALGSAFTASLISGTATPAQVWGFIRAVCDWGGKTGNRVRGIIQANYNSAFTQAQFTIAANALANVTSASTLTTLRTGLSHAISALTGIHGLSTSYASKMLRFLRPDLCGVFDSVIAGATGSPCDNGNFVEYSVRCLRIASDLTTAGVVNPRLAATHWRVGDVDQALFALCQGW